MNARTWLWNRLCSWVRARIHGPVMETWYRHEVAAGRGFDDVYEMREARTARGGER
jgi:hypothetical protein